MAKSALGLVIIVSLLTFGHAMAQEKEKKEKTHNNRVEYSTFSTGLDLELFLNSYEGYGKSEVTPWPKFTENSLDSKRIWVPLPRNTPLARQVVDMMLVTIVTSSNAECGIAPQLLFINLSNGASKMFASEYNICDRSGLLNSQAVRNQYIARYGMYDEKDYDRDMIIYNNVKNRYRVSVRPYIQQDGPSGVTVTVVDEGVFLGAYASWRIALRVAGADIKSRL